MKLSQHTVIYKYIKLYKCKAGTGGFEPSGCSVMSTMSLRGTFAEKACTVCTKKEVTPE